LYDARSSSGTAIIHNQATASTHGSFGILQFPACGPAQVFKCNFSRVLSPRIASDLFGNG